MLIMVAWDEMVTADFCLFIYFWLCWISVAAGGPLSSGSAWAPHRGGFFCCGAWALGHASFSACGSQALDHRLGSCAHRLTCPAACGISLDQRSN